MMHSAVPNVRLDQLCRLCAQRCREVVPIFSTHGQDRDLAMKINTILPIVVLPDDELPLQVCLRCLLWLETMHDLREHSREANKALQLLLLKEKQQKETTQTEGQSNGELQQDSGRTETLPSMDLQDISDEESLQSSEHLTLWCHECLLFFPDATSFTLHQRSLHKRDAIVCTECCLFFSSIFQLDAHKKEIHNIKKTRKSAHGNSNTTLTTQKEVEKIHSSMKTAIDTDHCYSKNSDSINQISTVNYIMNNGTIGVDTDCFNSSITCASNNKVTSGNRNVESPINDSEELDYNLGSESINRREVRLMKKCGVSRNNKKIKKIKKLTEFKCKTCQKTYPLEERSAYKTHWLAHSKEAALKRKAEKLKNSTIVCDYCDLRFTTERSKLSHMQLKHREYKPYMCDQCGKTFHLKKSVLNHVTTHQPERPFSCNLCDKTFSTEVYLRCHKNWIHAERVTCSVCSKTLRRTTRYKQHMLRHYKDRRFQCEECSESFFTRENLKEHMKNHSNTLYECEICGVCCSSDENLYSHNLQHIDPTTQNYICPIKSCTNTFESKNFLINHCKSHSNDDFKLLKKISINRNLAFFCWYCKKSFRNLPVYLEHIKNHSDVKNVIFSCNFCHKSFGDDKILLTHLKQHPEAFTFHCRHCKERFLTSELRQLHEGVTHGGMQFCKTCNKMFSNKCHLDRHKIVHTDNSLHRMFGCEHCSLRFTSKKNLSKHYVVHLAEKKFKCGICFRCFKFKQDLKKHMTTHINVKAYRCRHCDFSSNIRKDITEHKLLKHDDISGSDSDQDCNNVLFVFQ